MRDKKRGKKWKKMEEGEWPKCEKETCGKQGTDQIQMENTRRKHGGKEWKRLA